MVVGVFKSRVNPNRVEEFEMLYAKMGEHISKIEGYIGHKRYSAEDGEAVVVVEFETQEAFLAWDTHVEHKKVKQLGKNEDIFLTYDVTVGTVFEQSKKV